MLCIYIYIFVVSASLFRLSSKSNGLAARPRVAAAAQPAIFSRGFSLPRRATSRGFASAAAGSGNNVESAESNVPGMLTVKKLQKLVAGMSFGFLCAQSKQQQQTQQQYMS